VYITSKKLFIQYGLYQDAGAKCKSKVEATMTKENFSPKEVPFENEKSDLRCQAVGDARKTKQSSRIFCQF